MFALREIEGELWLARGPPTEGDEVGEGEGEAEAEEHGVGDAGVLSRSATTATTTTGGEFVCWSISLSFRRMSSSSCSHCALCFFDFLVSFLGSAGNSSSRCKMSFLFLLSSSLSVSPSLTSLLILPLLPVLILPDESSERRDAGFFCTGTCAGGCGA